MFGKSKRERVISPSRPKCLRKAATVTKRYAGARLSSVCFRALPGITFHPAHLVIACLPGDGAVPIGVQQTLSLRLASALAEQFLSTPHQDLLLLCRQHCIRGAPARTATAFEISDHEG